MKVTKISDFLQLITKKEYNKQDENNQNMVALTIAIGVMLDVRGPFFVNLSGDNG